MKDFIREKLCFYSPAFPGKTSGYDIIEMAKKYGARGVEMLSFWDELVDCDYGEAMKLGRCAKESGLYIPCFSLGTVLVGEGADESFARLKRAADICSALEVPYLHHTIYMSLDPKDVEGRKEDIRKAGVEMALKVSDYAKARGVKTILEDQGLVFNGVDGYGKLVAMTDGKIGTVLDLGNIMFVDEWAEDFGRAFAKNINHVHLKDYIRVEKTEPAPTQKYYTTEGGNYLIPCQFGTGSVRFETVKNLLDEIGYDGYFSMEFDRVMDETTLEKSLEYVASVFGK